jgi:hypothetical protein
MALQYRQLQSPEQVDTQTVDVGGSTAANSLAHALKSFEGVVSDIGAGIQKRSGEDAGAAAGASGNPKFKSGFWSQTAYAQAYNNAALRSYAIRAEADAEDQASRLTVEAGTDPQKFAATFGAVRDQTLKNAPPEARAILSDLYNRHLAEGVAKLSQAQATEIRGQQRNDVSDGILRSTDRIAHLRSQDDLASSAQADQEEMRLQMLIDSAEKDGTISPIEAAATRKSVSYDITKQTVVAKFEKVLESPYGDPVGFIKKLKDFNQTSDVLPPDEEHKLETTLMATLREHNSLEAMQHSQANALQESMMAAGDREATADLLAGRLTQRKLYDMVSQERISPAVARTLNNELSSGNTVADDQKLKAHVRLNVLDYSEQDILEMRGLSWQTKSDLIEQRRKDSEGWKGTQQAREAQARIDRSLGIPEGGLIGMLSGDKADQRDQAMTQWYNAVDALDPAERQSQVITMAEDVIGRYIRKNKASEAQRLRGLKDAYIRAHPLDSLNDEARKTYDTRISKFDTDIAAAEAEAARK